MKLEDLLGEVLYEELCDKGIVRILFVQFPSKFPSTANLVGRVNHMTYHHTDNDNTNKKKVLHANKHEYYHNNTINSVKIKCFEKLWSRL